MKYIFAGLSIICLLSGITVIFDMGLFPWTDKVLLFLFFTGIFFFALYRYIEVKETVVYNKEASRTRIINMNSMLILLTFTGILMFIIIFNN